ncbi:hypothetical protein [Methanimicrococcus blatticola]|uniref:Uncharacterized protein n=1 Tax=Methanimicrococcus blatticola TaxID=91560 RepID=A0A484F6B9_9EURY|nr:hypothetical protein [Methanimicrococcus blatticola]MBZ3935443.1 hypothetical protein [Methanimicrococcus blatticola]MCC2509087.1 hypothetical protein [Methanimicrococcus blatticola]TDQ69542.1 hypothetical protein C7391_0876 [Methanimicrococcus blatticola]
MGLFNSEMTPQKAVEALSSDKQEKIDKGIEFLQAGGPEMLPFMVEKFQTIVPQAARSRKHATVAERLYDLLCSADLPAELCTPFVEALINAPDNLEFSLDKLPAAVVINSYSFLEATIRDADVETKKKVVPFFDKIHLPPTILPILASFLNRESGYAAEALVLIPQVDGDLSPVSDALYNMLDLYPLGDNAAESILEMRGRLTPNIEKLDKYLMDFSSQVQKRAIRVAVPLAEDNSAVYALLEKSILADESARVHTLEALEKKEILRPDQMDLVWMILVNSTSPLTEERGMKFFGRIEKSVRPLILHYAQNGTSQEIARAFTCISFMKEEGPRVCKELLGVYMADDNLLFNRAGYSAFAIIASMMKVNCAEEAMAPSLAKKMRDYCTQNNLDTPTEVMALLAPGELSDVIEWSFKRIFDSYGIGYTPQFTEEMLSGISELVSFEAAVMNSFIKAIGFTYSYESGEDKPILTHKETAAAINRLRSVNTPATCNILHLISRKKDLEITQADPAGNVISSFTLSFEEHRKLALDELERRGFPAYNPINYLKQERPNY